MAFSYDPTDLATPLNHIRFLIQDTVDANHLFEDEELTYSLSAEANIYRVAATLCRSAALKVVQSAGFDDDITVWDPEEKAKVYLNLAASYDKKAEQTSTTGIEPGAILMNAKDLNGDDTYQAFTRELHLDNN